MAKKELPRNKDGVKMYPVCNWERNQHKVYNAHDRAVVRAIEENYSPESVAWLDKVERAMELIDSHIYDGTVYATWKDGEILKDIIYGYDARH